ncbi:SRPBCC family protein [Glaciibacter superstes]|uniref:SRPBCC family protein n=1 Tax=Glaciibacter superstes TaxID=501023 RepID=UPI0003B73D76|nr:SRPBCC family protein [Glaciibacter superstes]
MAVNYRSMSCTPEHVFEVLADGWLYPSWVVGASRMRDVDESWPQTGSRLHHSVGVWPLLLNDSTSVLEWDPPRRALFKARGWPAGEADVAIEAKETANGCLVRIVEDAVAGPARVLPKFVREAVLVPRNAETLQRLAYLAEGRAGRAH